MRSLFLVPNSSLLPLSPQLKYTVTSLSREFCFSIAEIRFGVFSFTKGAIPNWSKHDYFMSVDPWKNLKSAQVDELRQT